MPIPVNDTLRVFRGGIPVNDTLKFMDEPQAPAPQPEVGISRPPIPQNPTTGDALAARYGVIKTGDGTAFNGLSTQTPGELVDIFKQSYAASQGRAGVAQNVIRDPFSDAPIPVQPDQQPVVSPGEMAQKGFIAKGIYGLPDVAASSVRAMTERGVPLAVPGAAVGAAGGAAAGAVIGAITGPGEAISIPAFALANAGRGAAVGFTTGTTLGLYEDAIGDIAQTMTKNGVNPSDARLLSLLAAVPYAALDKLQLDVAVAPFVKSAAGQKIAEYVRRVGVDKLDSKTANILAKYVFSVGTETGAEAAQRGITEGAAAAGLAAQGDTEAARKVAAGIPAGMAEEAKGVLPAMTLLPVPGATYGAYKEVFAPPPPSAPPSDVEDVFVDGGETVEIAPPDAQTPTGPALPDVTAIPEPAAEPQEQPFVPDAQPPATDWKAYYTSLVTQGIDPEAAMMDVRAKREAELQRMFAEPTQADAVVDDTEQAVRRAAETINQEAANETPAIQPVEDVAVPGPAAEPGPAAVQPEVGDGTPQAVPAAPAAEIGKFDVAAEASALEEGAAALGYSGRLYTASTGTRYYTFSKETEDDNLVEVVVRVGDHGEVYTPQDGERQISVDPYGLSAAQALRLLEDPVSIPKYDATEDRAAQAEQNAEAMRRVQETPRGKLIARLGAAGVWQDMKREYSDANPQQRRALVARWAEEHDTTAGTVFSALTGGKTMPKNFATAVKRLSASTPASTPAEFDEKEYSEVDRKLSNGEYVPSDIVAKYPDLKELYNQEADPARDALSSLTRTELVATAKQFGIKANLTTPKLIDAIAEKQAQQVAVTSPEPEVTASDVPVTATQPARVTTMREARLAYKQAVDAAFQPGTDEHKFAMDAAPMVMKSFRNRDGSWDVGELQRIAVLKRGGVTNRATRIEDDDISMAVGPTFSVSAPTRDTRVVENAIRRLNVKSAVPSDVVMVKTLNDMPETVRAKYADQTAKGGSVRAMYDRGTGKTYFILSEIASGAKAEGVSPDVMAAGIYFHEMAAHHGLNVLPKPVRDTMIARVIADVPLAEMKSMLDPAYHDLSVTDMAEEYIAAVVEMARTEEGRRQLGTDRMAWWDRLWNWVVRNMLRRSEFKKLANVPKSVRIIADQLIQGLQDGAVRGGQPGVGQAAAMKSVDWAKLDADYLVAVERGDMDEAQRIVDEAASKEGYRTGPWWHGSPNSFTKFDYSNGDHFGFHFGTEAAADEAAKKHGGRWRDIQVDDNKDGTWSVWVEGEQFGNDLSSKAAAERLAKRLPQKVPLYKSWLKIQNPLRMTDLGVWMPGSVIGWLDDNKMISKKQLDGFYEARNWGKEREYVVSLLQKKGYDGIVYQNTEEDAGEDSLIAFSPSQIKSADPVTRDDAGNVIPLSQRFNAESPDIRFAQSSKGSPSPTPLERFDVPAAQDSKTWAVSTLRDYAERNGLDRKTLTMRVMRRPNGDRYGLLYRKGEGGQPGAPFPTTPRNAKERLDALREMMVNAEEKQAELARQRKRSKERWTPRNIWKSIEAALANDTTYLPEQGQEAVREIRYSDGATLQYARDIKAMVYKPLVDAGVSETEFGAYLVARRAATERAAIQNPGDDMYTDVAAGMSGVNAREVLAQMERENGPERWAAITKAGDTFTDLRKKHVIPKLKTSGLFTQAWLDKVENNDNYSTFEVLEYMDATLGGETKTARVYAQAGTAKDINNPFYATITNDRILLHAAAMNKGKLATVAVLAVDGQIEPAVMVGEAVRRPDDPRKGIIRLREDGKVKAYYVDGHIARVFDSPKDSLGASLFFRFLQLVTVPQKMLYTTLYPIFGVWNAQRDVRATVRALPKTGFGRMFMEMALTAPSAFKDAFRKESDPLMREMLEANLLITGRTWSALEADDEVTHFERMNKFFDLDRREQFIARAAKAATTDFNQFFERWTKLAAFRRMKALGYAADSPQMKKMIRELAGSPDFLARGTMTRWLNSVFIFSNPAVQGLRQVVRGAKNNPLGFAMKVTMYTAVPAIIQAVMEAGLFAHDDDDDKVPEAVREMRNILDADGWMSWLRDRYARVPERDKMLFNTVPVAADGDSTGYVPLPIDHAGQIVHAFTRKAVLSLLGIKSASTAKLTASSVPWNQGNLNQFLDLIMDAGLIWSGVNPQDEYTGQPTIDPTIFEAGGKDVGIEFAKQKFNDILGSIAFKFDRPYDVREKTPAEKAGATPFLGPAMRRFYRVEQRGLADTERLKQEDIDREKAGMRKGAKEFIQEFIPGNEKKPAPYAYRQAVKSGAIPKDYPKASFNALWRNALKNRTGKR